MIAVAAIAFGLIGLCWWRGDSAIFRRLHTLPEDLWPKVPRPRAPTPGDMIIDRMKAAHRLLAEIRAANGRYPEATEFQDAVSVLADVAKGNGYTVSYSVSEQDYDVTVSHVPSSAPRGTSAAGPSSMELRLTPTGIYEWDDSASATQPSRGNLVVPLSDPETS